MKEKIQPKINNPLYILFFLLPLYIVIDIIFKNIG